ncbi:hypothetical protein [Nevskia sp.]|uniref:NYN domain-containing protein n=1 Tax=Nevskia sp. TaxID=1929292 RepID=UPI0025E499F1|nr:hypothetical protein [Nevskia sp.]
MDSRCPPVLDPGLILIDALNVAYWCGAPPSLRLPISLLTGLQRAGHHALLYFDASAPYRLSDEGALYQRLITNTELTVVAPSGRTADALLLRHARTHGARIVSNDRFRDHRRRFRKLIDDPVRLFGGSVLEDRLRVPMLGLDVALLSLSAACEIS